ncbi:hypothetical protein HELRODRAFT_170287 [Helobdella robusta]|uniref:Uncharacterized protein n=1 Tax=Helobdella robusta TaxID=6412 RepID=T1F2V9_HELRO|nr:hypothetical protein HELRODRAFT_170287 [Helobdella robusta]ESO07741.1 hypothetical protein HELRODRAFT_170287 [Helobdella robusta]
MRMANERNGKLVERLRSWDEKLNVGTQSNDINSQFSFLKTNYWTTVTKIFPLWHEEWLEYVRNSKNTNANHASFARSKNVVSNKAQNSKEESKIRPQMRRNLRYTLTKNVVEQTSENKNNPNSNNQQTFITEQAEISKLRLTKIDRKEPNSQKMSVTKSDVNKNQCKSASKEHANVHTLNNAIKKGDSKLQSTKVFTKTVLSGVYSDKRSTTDLSSTSKATKKKEIRFNV